MKTWEDILRVATGDYVHITSSAVVESYDDNYKLIDGDDWCPSIMLNGGCVLQLPDHSRIVLEADGTLIVQVLKEAEV